MIFRFVVGTAKMRALADLLGLRAATAGPPVDVPPDETRLDLADGWVRLVRGTTLLLERPVATNAD